MTRVLVVLCLLARAAAADDVDLYGEAKKVDLYGPEQKSRLLEMRLRGFPAPLRALDPRVRAALGYELRLLPGSDTVEHVLGFDLPGIALRLPATRTGAGDFYVGDTTIAIGLPFFAGRRWAHDWHLTPAAIVLLGDELGPYADDNAYAVQLAAGRAADHFSLQLFPQIARFPVRQLGAPAGGADTVAAGSLLVGATAEGVELLLEVSGALPLSGDLAGDGVLEVAAGLRFRADDWALTAGLAVRPSQTHILYGIGPLDRPAAFEASLALTYLVGGLDGKLDRR